MHVVSCARDSSMPSTLTKPLAWTNTELFGPFRSRLVMPLAFQSSDDGILPAGRDSAAPDENPPAGRQSTSPDEIPPAGRDSTAPDEIPPPRT